MIRRRSRAVVAVVALALGVSTTGAAAANTTLPSDLPLQYGERGANVHKAHDRLDWLGYDLRTKETANDFFGRSTQYAVRQFQRKFFLPVTGTVDKSTWKALSEVGANVGKLPKACLKESKTICIDKTSKVLRLIIKGKVVQTIDVRFGVPGLETPTGTYRVYYKDRDATSGINGPNAPRVPMPYALFFNGDIAVHYSPTFAARGYYPGGGSHGCVNVADLDAAAQLFDQAPVGTLVHVY